MLEFEIRSEQPRPEEIPPAVLASFRRRSLAGRSVLAWGEHCTECAIPSCFRTCDLYASRSDGKCRRFRGGIEKIAAPLSQYGFITRVTFKPWGTFYTPGSVRVFARADEFERAYRAVAAAVRRLPTWLGAGRFRAPRAFYQLCKWGVRLGRKRRWGDEADAFLVQVYNPQTEPIALSVEFRPAAGRVPLAKLYRVDGGYHEIHVHAGEIRKTIDPDEPFSITLVPDVREEPVTAYFGLMDFVRFARPADDPCTHRKMKALVWDLDNTLWDGILVESSPEAIRLRDGVADILAALDQRGILLSVASKNDPDLAMDVLRRLGVADYFLHPQIHWNPKSLSLRRIREALNIGMDAIAFIDDSTFERAEVSQAVPEALCLDAINCHSLLHYPCFAGSTSADSRNRRKYYQAEDHRRTELSEQFAGDYAAFLRSCGIRLEIRRAEEAAYDRISDLIQRTNQMNFSANRYTRRQVAELLRRDDLEEYVLSASDRFGDYGIIGFALVDPHAARMTDLLFSCRIQMKRIEHAFLCYVLRRYRRRGLEAMEVVYCPTKRNAQCAAVFDDLGFRKTAEEGGRRIYSFRLDGNLPTEEMVAVAAEP